MRFLKFALLGLPLLLLPAQAEAVLINFDDPIPPGIVVQYFDGGETGPLASLPTPNEAALVTTLSPVDGSDALQLADIVDNNPFGLLLTFETPISFVSGVMGDFGGDGTRDNEIAYLTLFDAGGSVVGSGSFSSPFAEPNLKPVSANTGLTTVTYAAFTYENDLGFYTIDNVAFGVIPEPASMLLFGFSAAGAAAGRFFKKRK
jgi:hypothetical protein